MNRKERRKRGLRGTTPEQLIERLEQLGPILWEPDTPDGIRRGWAICRCCGERTLEIEFIDEQAVA